MRIPSTRQLQYFVTLSETGHFGRAAAASHVSQSAFSNAIKELESTLGTRLVDRTNRQVTITAMGQQIATQSRLVLHDIASLMELAAGDRKPLAGELRMGVIPTIAPFLLPRLLPRLRRAYPELRLFLSEDQTHTIHERLLDGELDVILIALPWELRGVDIMTLFQDPFRLACRDGTARVDPENYRFNRLDSDSILLLDEGHCLRDHALAACKIRNTQKIRQFAASTLLTLIEMVDSDLGITFLPEMARGSALLRNTRVKLHELAELSYRKIGLAWRKGSQRTDEFKLLGRFLKENRPAQT